MNAKIGLTGLAVAAVVGISAYSLMQVRDARESAREALLYADSVEAAHDTTKMVFKGALSDSSALITFWQLRALQNGQERDVLDRRLGQETVARASAEAELASLRSDLEAPVENDSTGRVATFEDHTPRYDLRAKITFPLNDVDLATGEFDVALKPIPLRFRLSCEDTDDINKAFVGVESPPDITITIGETSQDPRICNPQLYKSPDFNLFGLEIPRGPVMGATAGAVAGYTIGETGKDALNGALVGGLTGWALEEMFGGLFNFPF